MCDIYELYDIIYNIVIYVLISPNVSFFLVAFNTETELCGIGCIIGSVCGVPGIILLVVIVIIILLCYCRWKITSFCIEYYNAVLQYFQQHSSSDSTNSSECQTDGEQTPSGGMITSCVPS